MKKLNIANRTYSTQKGLTLIELMIATVLLAIITAVAVPSMKSLFERKSVSANGDFFIKSIKLARVEAIQRGKTVSIIPVNDDDWSQGWSAQFVNDDGDIENIRTFPALSGSPVFTSAPYSDATPFSILPTGQVSTVGAFDLYYPDCVGDQRLSFNVLLSGLIQRGVRSCSTITE